MKDKSVYSPHLRVKNIQEIDFQKLKKAGFKYVLIDRDNTIADHHVYNIKNKDFNDTLDEVLELFGSKNVAIFTNDLAAKNISGYNGEPYNIEFVKSNIKKPFGAHFIEAHFNTLNFKNNELF